MKSPVKIAALAIAILCLLSLLPLTACDTQDTPDAHDKAFLWQISSEVNSVYLLGSVHVASQAIYPLNSAIEDAFEEADHLVVEVDTTQLGIMHTLQLMLDYGTYPQGESLRDNIPDDLYDQLEEQFRGFGVSLGLLDSYRPWVVVTMQEELQLEALGYNAEYGIDLYFINRAAETGHAVLELETAEFQIELISVLPDELMILLLEEGVANPLTEEDADSLFEAWENGDTAAMERLLFAALDEEPALEPYYDQMIDQRNLNMAGIIEEFLADDETYFIVVGAGHLVGDNGLISILSGRGYVTEQL